jgi:flagellar biosynthetic protein FliR
MANLVLTFALGFALVMTRMAAFVAISPFPGPTVALQVRIGLVILLAVSATPALGTVPVHFDASAIGAAFGEAATGAAIGLIFRIAMMAADTLGGALAHAMGLTLASTFDPALGTQTDPFSKLVTTMSMVLAMALGAHRLVIGAVIASVEVVPLGTAPSLDAVFPTTLDWMSRSFDAGLGLAMPCVTVSLAVQIGLALVGRAAPSLQIFSIGLSITIGSSLLVIVVGARDLLAGLAARFSEIAPVLGRALAH